MVKAQIWGTPTDVEVIPVGYRLGDMLYVYDNITGRPLWWEHGHWIIDMAADYASGDSDGDAEAISPTMFEDWEITVDQMLRQRYNLALGPLHDWNEYELIEL